MLPLYPKTVNGYIYSVSLSAYTEAAVLNRMAYWILFLGLILAGIIKIVLIHRNAEKKQVSVTACSMVLSNLTVLLLALAGETYAVAMVFLLLLVKGALLIKTMKQRTI